MILVTGANGNLGSQAIDFFLIDQDLSTEIAGLVRSEEKGAELRGKGVDAVQQSGTARSFSPSRPGAPNYTKVSPDIAAPGRREALTFYLRREQERSGSVIVRCARSSKTHIEKCG